MLLRQLHAAMQRYIPKSNQYPGTPQHLKEGHYQLAQNVISCIARFWSINCLLNCHETETTMAIVRLAFSPLLSLLDHLPVAGQGLTLQLVSSWCEVYNIQIIHDSAAKTLALALPATVRRAGDFRQQLLMGKIMRCLWEFDENLVEDIASACGLRSCLYGK